MSYTQKAIIGFSGQSLLKLSTYVLSLIKVYFLARLLSPTDFGLFSLTAIALGITEAMTETGVNLTILQAAQSVKYFLDTAWVISITRGFIIGSLMILSGWGMSHFFGEPDLVMLIALAALVPVIKGFINPYIVVLHKKMLFWQDTLYRFAILATEIVMSIIFSYWWRSAIGLIAGLIASAVLEVSISFIFFRWRPKFIYSPSRGKIILNNAKFLSLSTVLNYLCENIDDFLIGRLTSTAELGLYHNAYSLTHKANFQLAKSVHHGIIPILTQISDQMARLKNAFFKSAASLLLIVVAISLPIAIFDRWLVLTFLGPEWIGTIPLIKPLLLAGVIQSLISICQTLLMAKKRFGYLNLQLLFELVSMIILIFWGGSQNGLTGAVYGLLWARFISLPVAGWGVKKIFSHS